MLVIKGKDSPKKSKNDFSLFLSTPKIAPAASKMMMKKQAGVTLAFSLKIPIQKLKKKRKQKAYLCLGSKTLFDCSKKGVNSLCHKMQKSKF